MTTQKEPLYSGTRPKHPIGGHINKLRELTTTIGDLWRSSALIQGALALMFGATVCYLSIVGQEIPGVLLALIGTIIGFYFGAKKTQER